MRMLRQKLLEGTALILTREVDINPTVIFAEVLDAEGTIAWVSTQGEWKDIVIDMYICADMIQIITYIWRNNRVQCTLFINAVLN